MAGKLRYLLERDGRYYARLVIPRELRPWLDGKSELRLPLGGDYRQAARKLAPAVAELQHKISDAERRAASQGRTTKTLAHYPLSDEQIAFLNYQARLKQDEDARNQLAAYAQIQIDDSFAQELRDGIAGKLTDKELYDLVGHRIDHFVRIGNTDVKRGTQEWRSLARKLCQSEYEALERMFELDEGISDGEIKTPFLKAAASAVHTTVSAVPITP
jgi:hypothetical protein